MSNTDEGAKGSQQERQDTVTITINEPSFEVHRGRWSVVDLKKLASVALADELEQLIDGKLTPLPDAGHVTIKGGEVFVSHPKDSASS